MTPIAAITYASPACSYQDAGRLGNLRYGIPPSGYLDDHAARWANQLLNNPPQATVIELCMGGLEIQFLKPAWLSFTGAGNCERLSRWTARQIQEGEVLRFNPSPDGIWGYLGIHGGWHCQNVLGSHSYHSRAQLGDPLLAGSLLYTNLPPTDQFPHIKARHVLASEYVHYYSDSPIGLFTGPHHDHFPAHSQQLITTSSWKVSSLSDRSGYRLIGAAIPTPPSLTKLPSLPTLPGSIQLTPSGELIVLLNDGPTVGGYPVIAMIDPLDLPRFVQSPPNRPLTFTWLKYA